MARKPQQLKGRGRHTAFGIKGRQPERLPPGIKLHPKTKAALQIQRQFRKTRYVPKKPIALGVECYQIRLAAQSTTLSQNAGSALLGPKNSTIMLSGMFHASHTVTDSSGAPYVIDGNWMKFVYGNTSKVRITFNNIAFHADNKQGLNLRFHHGLLKVTPDKFNATLTTQADWVAAIEVELRKQLYESDMCADFLDYSLKNRNIKLLNSFDVKPNRNHMIRKDEEMGTDHIKDFSSPPPVTFKINHPTPQMKTRVAYTADTNPVPVPHNLWVPFMVASCSQMTSNSGSFNIEYTSRSYFTDV
jgi:hypothetical protein